MAEQSQGRLEALFNAAIELSPADRGRFLDAECGDNSQLRAEIDSLLAHDAGATGFLRSPIKRSASDSAAPDESPASPPEPLPATIGRYQVLRKIGEGGMGVVYEARQESPSRTVALKVIRPGIASRGVLRRFEQEAHVLGQLQHPGIAHIYEAGTATVAAPGGLTAPQPFFAMEFVRGEPLAVYAERQQLGTRERMELVARVCDAVEHAHQHGVIHRDLKPGNILVASEGGESADDSAGHKTGFARSVPRTGTRSIRRIGQPKILDFGVARATDSDVQTMTLQTDVGQLIGTVPYMSPEQVTGDSSQLDTRSDVYALGVILYELLAHRLPHDVRGRSIAEAARIIREEEPSRLSSVDTLFRGDVETIVAKALDKDRTRRYGSAAELAADIRRYLADEPIVARPASTFYQLQKFARRNTALVAGVVLAFTALAFGVAATTWFALREARERRRAEALLVETRHARDAEAREHARAERRFDDVRKLANTFIRDVYEEIYSLPGATKARELVIRKGLEYVDSLATEARGDRRLSQELAEAYRRLGDVQGKAGSSNVGDTKGALESYQKALNLVAQINAGEPNSYNNLRALATCYDSVGLALRALGRTTEAIETFGKYQQVVEQMVALRPDDEDTKEALARGWANLGRMQAAQGKLPEAIINYEKYIAYTAQRTKDKPDDLQSRLNFAIVTLKIGEILVAQDKIDEGMTRFRKALEIEEELCKIEPQNPSYPTSVATTLQSISYLLADHGKAREALPYIDRMRALRETQVRSDEKDIRAQRNLAVVFYAYGLAYENLKKPQKALEAFNEYLKRIERVAAADPANIVVRRDLAIAVQKVGASQRSLKMWAEADKMLAKNVEMMEKLTAADPADADARRDLAIARYSRGNLYVEMANELEKSPDGQRDPLQRAVQELEASLEISRDMKKRGELAAEVDQEIRKTESAIQACKAQLNKINGAAPAAVSNSGD